MSHRQALLLAMAHGRAVLSPYFFSRYIRDLVVTVANSCAGCKICEESINILAYADDIVLVPPSWRDLQSLVHCHRYMLVHQI